MRILIVTGEIFPRLSNNANLLGKLIPFLQQENEIRVLSLNGKSVVQKQETFYGAKLYRLNTNIVSGFRRKLLYPAASKLFDHAGQSDYITTKLAAHTIKEIRIEFPFDAFLVSSEPFSAADIIRNHKNIRSVLYLMDPPECTQGLEGTNYRNRTLHSIFKNTDCMLTTPFIHEALSNLGRADGISIEEVGFPMICNSALGISKQKQTDKIVLLFTGWMCSDIRSPKYFLDILSRLDERFCVTFMGRECETLTKQFDVQTKAELITMPQQPYEAALQAMADADILINIGNSLPVHMPSKTLEYINTGKPVVNFYKMQDCPTLYYTNRYPLCLNLSEQDPDLDAAADRFMRFCLLNKGKTVDRAYIESEYADCTPEYIAGKILEALEKNHG